MTSGGTSNGVQVDAVKCACSRGVGRVRVVVCLNVGSKGMLARHVVIQGKACDDGTRRIILGNSALGWKHINKFNYSLGEGYDHLLGNTAVG